MHCSAMSTPEKIKAARERLGESQTAFGARFGVDQSTIARWEMRGVPDRGTARVAVENLLASLKEAAD